MVRRGGGGGEQGGIGAKGVVMVTSGRSRRSISAALLSNIMASTVGSVECSCQYAFWASRSSAISASLNLFF